MRRNAQVEHCGARFAGFAIQNLGIEFPAFRTTFQVAKRGMQANLNAAHFALKRVYCPQPETYPRGELDMHLRSTMIVCLLLSSVFVPACSQTNGSIPAGSRSVSGTYFGEYNAARDMRIIQLAVKVYF